MRRGHERVGFDIIVCVAKNVWRIEDKDREDDQENNNREAILDRVIRVERNRVLFRILNFNTCRVVVSRYVQGPDVQDHYASNHKWQQIVQREEALKRLVADRRSAHQPALNALTNQRDRSEQVDDHVRAVQRHLSPWQHVAEEGRRHHQEIDHTSQQPQHFARRFIRPVIEAPEHVDIDSEEEHRRADHVNIPDQPAIRHIAHNPLNRAKGLVDVSRVVHGQNDAGNDLDDQTDGENSAECVPVVQVLGGRKIDKAVMRQPDNRQAAIQPLGEACLWLVGGLVSAHRSLVLPLE